MGRISKASALLLAGLTLSACGGGGGGLNGFEAYNELFASTSGLSATPDVEMPSGSGTYSGFANLGINSAATNMFARAAVGEMTLNVNFGGGSALSGNIRNFQYFDQAPVSGSVSISGGTIVSNEVLGASASGTVAGRSLNYSVDGEFQGSGAQVLYMWFDGTSSSASTGTVNEIGVGIGLSN